MNKVESRKLKRLRGRLELGPPVGFYADRFLISGGQQIKTHSFSKNKEKSKIHNDKSIASKSFRKYFILRSMPSSTQRAWSDQNQAGAIYGSVNSTSALIIKDGMGKLHIHLSFVELFTITLILFWLFITHVGESNEVNTRPMKHRLPLINNTNSI